MDQQSLSRIHFQQKYGIPCCQGFIKYSQTSLFLKINQEKSPKKGSNFSQNNGLIVTKLSKQLTVKSNDWTNNDKIIHELNCQISQELIISHVFGGRPVQYCSTQNCRNQRTSGDEKCNFHTIIQHYFNSGYSYHMKPGTKQKKNEKGLVQSSSESQLSQQVSKKALDRKYGKITRNPEVKVESKSKSNGVNSIIGKGPRVQNNDVREVITSPEAIPLSKKTSTESLIPYIDRKKKKLQGDHKQMTPSQSIKSPEIAKKYKSSDMLIQKKSASSNDKLLTKSKIKQKNSLLTLGGRLIEQNKGKDNQVKQLTIKLSEGKEEASEGQEKKRIHKQKKPGIPKMNIKKKCQDDVKIEELTIKEEIKSRQSNLKVFKSFSPKMQKNKILTQDEKSKFNILKDSKNVEKKGESKKQNEKIEQENKNNNESKTSKLTIFPESEDEHKNEKQVKQMLGNKEQKEDKKNEQFESIKEEKRQSRKGKSPEQTQIKIQAFLEKQKQRLHQANIETLNSQQIGKLYLKQHTNLNEQYQKQLQKLEKTETQSNEENVNKNKKIEDIEKYRSEEKQKDHEIQENELNEGNFKNQTQIEKDVKESIPFDNRSLHQIEQLPENNEEQFSSSDDHSQFSQTQLQYEDGADIEDYLTKVQMKNEERHRKIHVELEKLRARGEEKQNKEVFYPFLKRDSERLLMACAKFEDLNRMDNFYSFHEFIDITDNFLNYIEEFGYDFYFINHKNVRDGFKFSAFRRNVDVLYQCQNCKIGKSKQRKWISSFGVLEIVYNFEELIDFFNLNPDLMKEDDKKQFRQMRQSQIEEKYRNQMRFPKMLRYRQKIYRQRCNNCQFWCMGMVYKPHLIGSLIQFGSLISSILTFRYIGEKDLVGVYDLKRREEHYPYHCEACQHYVCYSITLKTRVSEQKNKRKQKSIQYKPKYE